MELPRGRDQLFVLSHRQLPAFVYHIVAARFLPARGAPRAKYHGGDVGGSLRRLLSFAIPIDRPKGQVDDSKISS
jgi:hypothetical protein